MIGATKAHRDLVSTVVRSLVIGPMVGCLFLNTAAAEPLIATKQGFVRGLETQNVDIFLGIPYAAPPVGDLRWKPPQPHASWSGILSATKFGSHCAQTARVVGVSSSTEDCLFLNVYVPNGKDNGEAQAGGAEAQGSTDLRGRPVMVWIHGGDLTAGESNDFDASVLASKGNVIVVTINYRLGVFGFLAHPALTAESPNHASGNYGILDQQFALKWVQQNIRAFGGDPGNVTVFGQSGGGGKVSTLMAMSAGKGLFHRAVVQSGALLRLASLEESARFGHAFLAELNLSKSGIDKIQTMPLDALYAASRSAAAKLGGDSRVPGGRGPAFGFRPVVDGKVIAAHPFDPVAPEVSANVPLLIGTNLNEFIHGVDQPDADSLTNEDLLKQFDSRYGVKAQAIVESLRREYPWAKPFDIFSIAGNRLRETSATQARRKAALGAAPAYVYLFGWQTPMLDGRPRAFHSCEISFVFNNADLCVNYSGGTPEALALSRKVSQAWVSFARTGRSEPFRLAEMGPRQRRKAACDVFR